VRSWLGFHQKSAYCQPSSSFRPPPLRYCNPNLRPAKNNYRRFSTSVTDAFLEFMNRKQPALKLLDLTLLQYGDHHVPSSLPIFAPHLGSLNTPWNFRTSDHSTIRREVEYLNTRTCARLVAVWHTGSVRAGIPHILSSNTSFARRDCDVP
jgi:hypothetical protein